MGIRNPNTTNYVHNDEPNIYDLHKSMQYDTAGQPQLRTNNFILDVSAGRVPGHSIVFISGRNRLVPLNTEITVWEQGGMYPWSVWNTGAGTLTIVSDNAADTAITILLNGLDANYNLQTEVVTVNGTTTVTSTKSFIRLNSAVNIGSKAGVGTLIIQRNGTTVGVIVAKAQNTKMAIYTVPNGYTAFSVFGDFSVSRNEAAELNAHWRFFGGVFIDVYSVQVYQSSYSALPPYPGAIPQKTDIDNRVDFGTANNMVAYSNQQLLLVENTYL